MSASTADEQSNIELPVRPRLTGRIMQRVFALFIGTFIAFALAEGLFRATGVGRVLLHRPDKTYGMVLIPGAKGWFVNEGRSFVRINSAGFRDTDHPTVPAPNTLRIAVLGDSFTEALQVPAEEAFWSVAQQQLQGCRCLDGRNVEMMSFGVSGYSTASELLLLENRVWEWSPDVVVLAFLSGNDVADNHPSLGAVASPFFRLIDDQLVLDDSRARSLSSVGKALHWMTRRSRVLQVLNQVRSNYGLCGKVGPCGEDLDVSQGEAGLRNQIYLEPSDSTWIEAWQVTEALIVKMREKVEARQAQFLVVGLSNSIQVHPDPSVRNRFTKSIDAKDLSYPDRRLAEFGRRNGIQLLALAPIFAERVAKNNLYLHGFKKTGLGKGHWNKDGHRLAGETIASWLPKVLNIKSGSSVPHRKTPAVRSSGDGTVLP
jgi:hypothetical protein